MSASFTIYRPVLLLFLLSLPISMLYAQTETTYRLFSKNMFSDYLSILTIYSAAKALFSFVLQVPLVKGTEKLSMKTILFITYICYSLRSPALHAQPPDNAFSDGDGDDGWRKHRINSHPDLHFEIGTAPSARPVLCGIRPALGYLPLNRAPGRRADPDIVWRRSDFYSLPRVCLQQVYA